VGVDVNTASVALLARISGLNATLAQNIVSHRDEHGAFKTRAALKKVARLGEKTFEQAAGFLRVMNGDNPLDSSAVHPEAYPLVQRIAAETDRDIRSIRRSTPTKRSVCQRSPTSCKSWKNPVATRVPSSRPPSSRKASKTSRTCNWG
jgi:competence ComEA-like helix-hairpin-helix protein